MAAEYGIAGQTALDELGTALVDVTFVVVDLETTGGSPASHAITEVGAVKVRRGDVLGEFHSLVNPQSAIPPFIAVLTGITDAMVASAPTLAGVLPGFLEWAAGSVLVAHNAPFDLGFLRAGCEHLGLTWPPFDSLDTARLARRVLARDEAPDCRLSSLARVFRTAVTPNHRALEDARATVDVLHGLIERVGGLGVHTLEELRAFSALVTPEVRRKRRLAEGLPQAPGVYLFRDGTGRPLYVGKSRNLATRVRQYFVASERRTRMTEMVRIAERVDHVPCAHELEAAVRELRLIAEHKPPYNRRSRFPERASYLVLTTEAFPRLAIVRRPPSDDVTWLGPFPSTRLADDARHALYEAFPVRRCTPRLSSKRPSPRCALADLGRCIAPCEGGPEAAAAYASIVDAVRRSLTDPAPVLAATERRLADLAAAERFEEAAGGRDRLAAFLRAAIRRDRLRALVHCGRLVAAAPAPTPGGWHLAVVSRGRLVAAGVVPPGAAPRPYIDALVASAESVRPETADTPPGAAASAEEVECVIRWLERPGTRLVDADQPWSSPARGAARHSGWLAGIATAARTPDPFADRRRLRPVR